jgi:hypothetical protein
MAIVKELTEKLEARVAELEAEREEMRKLLVRVKMYVPDSQQELHARIHRVTV